ncbi:MAG: bifunctional DNA-formamidopyrimidine glycosylase/DNA-(apurinic or apyrimidinic site) lyase [Myxococcales bacterium]|nr:MAG: bifunctional DNA-formamidopyrimidine glycosylase/DNA-(apurinic or apyrimidinic site) lyase [Myxococcales bacterium]
MPELPEVETVVRQLRPLVIRKRVRSLAFFDPRLGPPPREVFTDRRVLGVQRVGKQIVLTFSATVDDPELLYIAVHLRMTGRLIVRARWEKPPEKHWRAVLEFEDGYLDFIDARRFGTILMARNVEAFAPTGLDPLSQRFTARALAKMLAGVRQPIKPWLIRQDRIVGLGNIYASEILFAAGIHPSRLAGSLSQKEIEQLQDCCRRILNKAIKFCGTTFSDFQSATGESGAFQHFLKVYDREALPCRACKTEIVRLVQAGRSTFFCPHCQPKKSRPVKSSNRSR